MNNLMVIDGIEVRRDAYGRYSLNDLHRQQCIWFKMPETKEPEILSSQQTVELFVKRIDQHRNSK